jgi:hypothetical protein
MENAQASDAYDAYADADAKRASMKKNSFIM